MAGVTQAMVDAAIERMKDANLRLQRAVEKSPSDRTHRGQHISTWNAHEARIHKLYMAYDKARDEAGRLKREFREGSVSNPTPVRGNTYMVSTKRGLVPAKFIAETWAYYVFQPTAGGKEIVMRKSTFSKRVANPAAALRGTVADIPSTWTPVMVRKVGKAVQIKMRGR